MSVIKTSWNACVYYRQEAYSNLATGGNDRHQRVAILHPKYLPSGISVWSWSNRFTVL